MGRRQRAVENLVNTMTDLSFYKGKTVLVTGHTGFKGSWLCAILIAAGAEVVGYALEPPTEPSHFALTDVGARMHSVIADVRDFERMHAVFRETRPEIVLHLAAQPIVLEGYRRPRETFDTNVMGTVNLLECVHRTDSVRSVLNVTTDKVYLNDESGRPFCEDDPLDGFDPYSNSKSCSELVTHSYKRAFLDAAGVAVSTARAGNVIGGGDFAENRIVPDCVRAALRGETIRLRNPNAVRPFQHVLEPLGAYLMIAAAQAEDPHLSGYYNVGPNDTDCLTTGELATLFCAAWGCGLSCADVRTDGPHEAGFLRLDCTKLRQTFGWEPRWAAKQAIEKTVEWTKAYARGEDMATVTDRQITEFFHA